MPVSMSNIKVVDQLGDVYWRLQNLYHCIDKKGNCVKFRMNDAQKTAFKSLWWRTIVPKSRQKGFTTFFAIAGLDYAFFNRDKKAGFLAHTAADAERIYIDKILYVLDRMPPSLLRGNPTTRRQDAGGFVSFRNGSSITVAQSFRSATLNFLHCSEMGKIAASYPQRAREIITGTLPAVPSDGRVIIESTSEGAYGAYYDLCMKAKTKEESGRPLTKLDFKIIFSGWTTDPDCRLPPGDTKYVVITDVDEKYFAKIEDRLGVTLSPEQKAWYVTMKENQGSYMFQEFPADLDECFQTVIEGAYYEKQISQARKDGRIGDYPYVPGVPVHSVFDIGVADDTALWMWQELPGEFRFIDCYIASGEGMGHYFDYMKEKGYEYDEYWAPHDIAVRSWTTGVSRIETAATKYGIHFQTAPKLPIADGIDAVRRVFKHCTFNEATCSDGINGLSSYRKEWDEKRGCYKNKPRHDAAEHPSSSFRYFAVAKESLVDKHIGELADTASLPSQADIWDNALV